jgi:hypothetical protein
LAKADGPVTIQVARAKARTVIGNLAPRRNGENIVVLLFMFPLGFIQEWQAPAGRPRRAFPPPDTIDYDLRVETGPEHVRNYFPLPIPMIRSAAAV